MWSCNVATQVSQLRGSGTRSTGGCSSLTTTPTTPRRRNTSHATCVMTSGRRTLGRIHSFRRQGKSRRQLLTDVTRSLSRVASLSPETIFTRSESSETSLQDARDVGLVQSEHVLDQQQDHGGEYVSCRAQDDEAVPVTWWDQAMDVLPSRVRGLIMLNLLVLLCGTNWVVVKDAGGVFDPFSFASLRFLVASALFAPVLLSAVKNTEVVKGGVEIGVYTAVGYLLQAQGLLTTDASRASFLSTFTVLVVPFLAGLSGRGVRPITWASALAALVGVSMLEQSGSAPSWGDLWSALSAMAFGVQMFRTEYWSRVLGKDSAFQLMSVVLTTTAFLSTLVAGVAHPSETAMIFKSLSTTGSLSSEYMSSIPWGEVFYTGLLTTDVVLLMEVVALQDVSSVEASIIYTLEPVIGAAFAFVALGERWGPLGWAGAGLIVTSCLVTQMLGSDEDEEEEEKEEEEQTQEHEQPPLSSF